MRLLAGVLHSDEIVWNSYTWDADAHKQINTNSQKVGQTLVSWPRNGLLYEAGKQTVICSLDLPEGKWLLFGAALAWGDLIISGADVQLFIGRQYNTSVGMSSNAFAYSSGGKTVTLEVNAVVGAGGINNDNNYHGLKAVRIG